MKTLLVLISLFVLAGCSSTAGFKNEALENRIVFTDNCDEMFVNSKWWLFSVGSAISPKDLGVCKKLKEYDE